MKIPHTSPWRIESGARSLLTRIEAGRRHPGHAHFWDRALSRREFVQTTAAAAGLVLASPLKTMAQTVPGNTPKPIPGGIQPFGPGTEVFHVLGPHTFTPDPDGDRSAIFDFNGTIGYSVIRGTGHARGPQAAARSLNFEVDVRFMQGVYVAEDGRRRHGTFCLL